jgi:hypothetical protein
MIGDFFEQFLIEFIRALFVDGLSEHVRGRLGTARQAQRRRQHSKKALRLIRNLSTGESKKVR